ncbi:MAG TPA: NUDIX hydrolase [Candidatus Sulfotelmatobacter sp.]|nr:NUDIX hydrolase [Candidatus Sulfotelmatobacter sp.]
MDARSSRSDGQVAHLKETLLQRSEIYSGRLLSFFRDEVRLADGGSAAREVVEHPGAVAVVATDSEGKVVLVRQWRHAVGRALWEIPAGTSEPDEEARATAERELREETGFAARRWRRMAAAPVSPGYSSELVTFFLAEDLVAGEARTDADEAVEVARFTPGDVAGMASRDEVDIKTVAGLALAGLFTTAIRDV